MNSDTKTWRQCRFSNQLGMLRLQHTQITLNQQYVNSM